MTEREAIAILQKWFFKKTDPGDDSSVIKEVIPVVLNENGRPKFNENKKLILDKQKTISAEEFFPDDINDYRSFKDHYKEYRNAQNVLWKNYFNMIQSQLFNRESIWIDVITNSIERDNEQIENLDINKNQSIKKYEGSIIEDMAKDIFMKIVYKEIYHWDSDKGDFGGWVRTITSNWVKNFKKKLYVPMPKKKKIEAELNDKKNETEEIKNQKNYKRMQELSEEIINIFTNGKSIEGELIKKQQLQKLIKCVHEKLRQFSKLYPDHAEVLCLSAFGDYDLKNIAEIMQKKYTTMKVFISDSRKRAYKFFLPCIKFMN